MFNTIQSLVLWLLNGAHFVCTPFTVDGESAVLYTKQENTLLDMNCDIDGDMENQVEVEEKTRLINQVLELQHTLEGKTHLDRSAPVLF
ncbi:putative short coiled-coil protein A-like isoform 2 [Scophthalmus maximus]|uniref:Putative short coiled-coil protein A-like isoform 2 n=1 Tax=Scophthalmus maximus TaxID=52904 RepID=A0A2U9BSG5_SCOMX|nr:putative short coiled-coil protein A-like isoform 2 [Scophthalmus maximus]